MAQPSPGQTEESVWFELSTQVQTLAQTLQGVGSWCRTLGSLLGLLALVPKLSKDGEVKQGKQRAA